MKRTRRNEKGQTMVEYLLVIVLVALACFAMWQTLANQMETTGGNIAATMATEAGAGGGE